MPTWILSEGPLPHPPDSIKELASIQSSLKKLKGVYIENSRTYAYGHQSPWCTPTISKARWWKQPLKPCLHLQGLQFIVLAKVSHPSALLALLQHSQSHPESWRGPHRPLAWPPPLLQTVCRERKAVGLGDQNLRATLATRSPQASHVLWNCSCPQNEDIALESHNVG